MQREKAIQFIKKNARPIDLAVYKCLLDGESNQAVVYELSTFQNADGGFGNGLEADYWNPNSSPIATNDAIITLVKTNALDNAKDMIYGIVRYLESHDSFDEEKKCWLFAIESNREYPHAIWWEKEGNGIHGYNPTVSLATFLLCYGKGDPIYKEIVQNAVDKLGNDNDVSGDALKCFLLSYELLYRNQIIDVVDLPKFKNMLCTKLESVICKDISKYGVEYVPVPSDFFTGMYTEFISSEVQKLINNEKDILSSLQKEDGGFDITWKWGTDYPEFEQARNWWRPKITIDKLLFMMN